MIIAINAVAMARVEHYTSVVERRSLRGIFIV